MKKKNNFCICRDRELNKIQKMVIEQIFMRKILAMANSKSTRQKCFQPILRRLAPGILVMSIIQNILDIKMGINFFLICDLCHMPFVGNMGSQTEIIIFLNHCLNSAWKLIL